MIAAVTLFAGRPIRSSWRRAGRSWSPGRRRSSAEVDLGLAIRSRPAASRRRVAAPSRARSAGATRAGHGRRPAEPGDERRVVDLALAPDARVVVRRLDRRGRGPRARESTSPDGRIRIEPLPAADVRVDVRLTADGEATPARVRFVAADGRYLPPLGHRDEVNPGIFEDIGRRPDPRRRHLRLRPGRVRDRPAARRRRGRGRQGLRPPAGPHDARPVDAGDPGARDRARPRRSTCGPPAGAPPTRTSTSCRRRPRCSRRPPRTSRSSTCSRPSSATSSRTSRTCRSGRSRIRAVATS